MSQKVAKRQLTLQISNNKGLFKELQFLGAIRERLDLTPDILAGPRGPLPCGPGAAITRAAAPFVYRLGLKIFILARGVRLP